MNNSDKIILLFFRYKHFFALCLLFNVVASGLLIRTNAREVSYKAKVKVVFNKVKASFGNNQSMDYLFGDDAYTFINTLHMDSVLNQVINAYDLSTHYGISQQQVDGQSVARTILRSNISFELQPHGIYLYYTDRDADVAKKALKKLAESVENHYYFLIDQNNEVTQTIAEHQLATIDTVLRSLNQEITTVLRMFPDTSYVRRLNIGQKLDQTIAQKFSLSSISHQLSSTSEMPKYIPYFIINEGVSMNTVNWLAMLSLAIIGNLIAWVIEINGLLLFHYILSKYQELQQKNLL